MNVQIKSNQREREVLYISSYNSFILKHALKSDIHVYCNGRSQLYCDIVKQVMIKYMYNIF